MIAGIEKVTARRVWLVPDFVVWGLPQWEEIEFLTIEKVATDQTVLYGSLTIGDTAQQVTFSDLTDHRGNRLPSTITSPVVMIRSRSREAVFVVSEESESAFKIARDPDAAGPVRIDMLVMEMGD